MTITPEQLADWQRLAEAATSGPWEDYAETVVLNELGKLRASDGVWRPKHGVRTTWEHGQVHSKMNIFYGTTSPYTIPAHDVDAEGADAAFIAAARTAVPALLAEVERLETLAGSLQADNRNLHRVIEGLTLERDALREAGKQAREHIKLVYGGDHGRDALAALGTVLGEKP